MKFNVNAINVNDIHKRSSLYTIYYSFRNVNKIFNKIKLKFFVF